MTGNAAGRWVLMKPSEPCKPPLCTGVHGEALALEAMGWHGERHQWVWVPYTCYYHLYSPADIQKCAAQANIDWLLITGDSQV